MGAASYAADRELIQRRIGLTYGLFALVLTGLLVVTNGALLFIEPAEVVRFYFTKVTYLASIAVVALAWRIGRGRVLAPRVLGLVDGGTLLAMIALLSFTTTFAPARVHVAYVATVLFALIVPLRAALVPAPPSWTMIVSAVAAIPVPIGAYLAGRSTEGGLSVTFDVVMAAACCAAATVAAWAISRVVYGLRREIKSAMRLGQYTLQEKIGQGGMGVVYRAKHALLRRPTAVKLLATTGADDVGSKRFEREVQLTSQLTHPNTIAIYDYGHTQEGVFYYAMELLDGVTLAELCEEHGPQQPGRVLYILVQAARALVEAHSAGLIHRDVKPANIFLCVRGGMHDFVKVLDFGLVKEVGKREPAVSAPDAIAGTPLYSAPETITDPEAVGAPVDVYALGAVGYFLLTGEPPFNAATVVEAFHAHVYEAPGRPSTRLGKPVPEDVEALVMSCLAKKAADRPSAKVLADSLATLLLSHPWGEEEASAWWQSHRPPTAQPPHAVVGDPALTDGLGATETSDVPVALRVRLRTPS